ncbi:hypothetical protein CHLNCDRAFT_133509 [Chlorella variabilis]|uniref:Neurotransmitter-gated ion-channel ligand-binding domain-containing protein n=1 Tax=Chlorella variabilis TaxID=554065 RepID=E1Z387_CHLVA|nr:hypothetical protein CHLNCDRAFT_133509 [Chlorella variabilis]EFN59796.1 hypothetical protein CHLNCDRAFT_133509 [Chlorella variabilis]|eukprot:XP_005851898.1 hypothetical protein CHLNCDRAFT_133509 [Chlorella variabilis]
MGVAFLLGMALLAISPCSAQLESVYLDRRLEVYEDNYRWEGVHYFYLSWTDYSAVEAIQEQSVQAITNSSFKCDFYCSNNAYGFPQDREIMYNIFAADDGSMLWEVRVHGIYYQPMDFSHFPFDSFDLALELRFYDPTRLISTEELYGYNHSGITVIYTIGRGDDASSWAVTDYSLETYSVDMGNWYSQYSDLTSNPYDPMPLAPPNARITGGLVDDEGNPINVFTYGSWLLAAVAAAGESSLETRLEMVVTLFLALTAVQFVGIGQIPTSSYVVPTQQLVLTTYTHLFLFLLAIESIAKRKEAWRRYCKLRDQGKLEGGQNPTLASAASAAIPADTCPEDEEQQQSTATDGVDVDAEKPDMQTAVDNKQGWFNFTCSSCFKPPQRGDASIANGDLMAERTPRRQFGIFFRSPKVDNLSAVFLAVGYSVTAILIFTLQSGYIDLFPEE